MLSFLRKKAAKTPGDAPSLEALLPRCAEAVANVCRAVVGPRDAQDAAQESFERIVRNFGAFDESRGAFVPWACAVARNVCRDRLRRRGIELRTFEDGVDLERTGAHPSLGLERSPEREAERAELAAHIDDVLATLPETQRTALVLFHLHDLSYDEIASVLGVPVGTVMTWLHRGRARIRAAWEAS